MRPNSQDAVREFRPYFDVAPVYGHGPSLEEFTRTTPLTVGSPQQVIERYAGMRDHVGDYQRQLFLMDHAGLPLPVVLEQLRQLEAKFNGYLAYALDGFLAAQYPDYEGKPVCIRLDCVMPPGDEERGLLSAMQGFATSVEIRFEVNVIQG